MHKSCLFPVYRARAVYEHWVFLSAHTQNGQLADREEILAEFHKRCAGLELQTTPLSPKGNTWHLRSLSGAAPADSGVDTYQSQLFLSYLLHCLTLGALHLSDFESIHLVLLLCIMAQPAHIQLTTARRLQHIETCDHMGHGQVNDGYVSLTHESGYAYTLG